MKLLSTDIFIDLIKVSERVISQRKVITIRDCVVLKIQN